MLIEAKNISHTYKSRGAANEVLFDVSIQVEAGETVGLLGQSGCGKSTLGQIICGLIKPSSGTVFYNDTPARLPYKGQLRKEIQILFQHPELSFNPRLKLEKSLREIYALYDIPCSRKELLKKLEPFGIYMEHLERYPAQLSGGELQRIALFRALLVEPRFLVLDEPTSMLDAISQAQIMNLLGEQKNKGISYLLITHDKKLCEIMSDRNYEIKSGRITETEK